MKTFGELAQEKLGDASYDFAVPQDWAFMIEVKTGIYPVSHVVWLYDEKARVFGRPYPLTYKGFMALHLAGQLEREFKIGDGGYG